MNPVPRFGARLGVRALVQAAARNRALFANAAALFGSTVVTAGLGALYWALAARVFSPQSVGIAAAAISSMTLVAQVSTLGLGTILLGQIGEHRSGARTLVGSAVLVSGGTGVLLGVASLLVATAVVPELSALLVPIGVASFALGVASTASGLVTDQAFLGLGRGMLQLVRNGIASVTKVAALVILGLLGAAAAGGLGLFVTWVAGAVVSLGILLVLARQRDTHPLPIWRVGSGIGRLAVRHHLLNLSILAPSLLLPLVVTAMTSAEQNAYFYIAYVVASFGWAIPSALTTSIYAAGAGDVDRLVHRVRLVFWLSIGAGVLMNAVLLVAAQPILSVFGRSYATESETLLRLFGLGMFPVTLNSLFVPIVRVERRFMSGTSLMILSLVIELTVVAIGAYLGGVTGAGVGWLVGLSLSVIPFIPTIVRVAVLRRVEPIERDLLGPVQTLASGRRRGGGGYAREEVDPGPTS